MKELKKYQFCKNCKLWSGEIATARMPGVRPGHRVCQRPRVENTREFRAPSDWCSSWKAQESNQ